MQKTKQNHWDLERVFTIIGAVVIAMAGGGLESTRLRIAGFLRAG